MSRIIVADDDEIMRSMLRDTLERSGYSVMEAPDGNVAIGFQNKKPADLIILDILMPEKEGLETIAELRRGFPEVKIIAISGGGYIDSDTYLYLAAKMGATRTFTKPIVRKNFLEAVKALVK